MLLPHGIGAAIRAVTSSVSRLCRLILLPLIAFAVLRGADQTGSLAGTVFDPSGLIVVAAHVVATDEATNISRETSTDNDGAFWVPLLTPGIYSVRIRVKSFREEILQHVVVDVDKTSRLAIRLQLGELKQSFVVTDVPQALDVDDSTIGIPIGRSSINYLPLNERNFLSFGLLVPGAQLPPDGSQNSVDGVTLSLNGNREQANNFLLDGTDNNDQSINGYTALPSPDAIREFQVQAANSSAEFGRNGGAQINVVLMGGGNSLHGTAFEFLRNRHLDARNFFDLPDCRPDSQAGSCGSIPRLDRNQFGGSLGGPIVKDKLFYFFSYETLLLREAVTQTATVPSLIDRQTALAAVPQAFRSQAGNSVLNLYPAANAGSPLNSSKQFVGQPLLLQTTYQPLAKIDLRATNSDSIAFHYALYDSSRLNPYDPFYAFTRLPGYGTSYPAFGQNIGLSWAHIVNAHTVNDLRLGFDRTNAGILQQNAGQDYSAQLEFPSVAQSNLDKGYPNIILSGFDGIGSPTNTPQHRYNNTSQIGDTLAWNPPGLNGSQRIKAGFDIHLTQLNFFLDPAARGEWEFTGALTGNPLEDLLYGLPTLAITVSGNSQSSFRTSSQAYFVQDDIRVKDRLTINLGLRYEFNSPPVETHNRLSVPILGSQSLTCTPQPDCQFALVGTNGVPRSVYKPTYTNFEPRIGFAWQPLRGGSLVIRSAYGLFYDVGILNFNVEPRFNPPFVQSQVFLTNGFSSIQSIVNQSPLPSPSLPFMLASNYRDAQVQQWNFDIQQTLRSVLFDLAYVGTKGSHLIDRRNINQPEPGNVAPYPEFGPVEYFESGASSIYHSLQFRSERRFMNGSSFLGSYTWSKSIDNSSGLFSNAAEPAFPQDSNNLSAERGPSSFNAGQRFVFSYIYEVPFGPHKAHLRTGAPGAILGGWTLSGIATVQNGRPFTVTRGVDQSGTGNSELGIFTDRPDEIANPFTAGPVLNNPNPACHLTQSEGGLAADVVRTPSSWFNPCAFAAAPGKFGDAGRNSILGPALVNLDFAMIKQAAFKESQRLQLRFEFFNILNHPNFDTPDANFDSPNFGRVLSSNAFGTKPPRQVQLAVKYIF